MASWRCQRCAQGSVHDFTHGANGYRKHGCRCEVCTHGNRVEKWVYNNQRGGLARKRARYSPEKRQAQYHADLDRICERNREYARRHQGRMSLLQRERYEYNPGANAAAYKRRMQKRRNIEAVNNRKRWTSEEDAVATSNLSVLEISHRLGRTYSAVESRRAELRMKEQGA